MKEQAVNLARARDGIGAGTESRSREREGDEGFSELFPAPAQGEPFLLTPGPLTTSLRVKRSMLRDWGSWDEDFRAMMRVIRARLIELAGENAGDFLDCVPIQGSGTYAVEAMLGSFTGPGDKVLVLSNGSYGQRAAETLKYMGRSLSVFDKGEESAPRAGDALRAIEKEPDVTHVFVVHCETSSGILNPVAEIAEAVRSSGRKLLVDSMSAFGALPLDAAEIGYAAMATSANKCIEGVPGFGIVLARKDELKAARGKAHSLSLDLEAQWRYANETGQWRFTPATHALAAFLEALQEHEEEGGIEGRGARYARNRDVLVEGMRSLGFETLLGDEWLSPIIVSFLEPRDSAFSFGRFYDALKAKGFIIYPGKLTQAPTFRIGCVGRLDEAIMRRVVRAVSEALDEMGVKDARPAPRQGDRAQAERKA